MDLLLLISIISIATGLISAYLFWLFAWGIKVVIHVMENPISEPLRIGQDTINLNTNLTEDNICILAFLNQSRFPINIEEIFFIVKQMKGIQYGHNNFTIENIAPKEIGPRDIKSERFIRLAFKYNLDLPEMKRTPEYKLVPLRVPNKEIKASIQYIIIRCRGKGNFPISSFRESGPLRELKITVTRNSLPHKK